MDEILLQNRINMKSIVIIPAFNEEAAINMFSKIQELSWIQNLLSFGAYTKINVVAP